ncbi:MAG: WhiB family transcriptional regulator [Acidimicrobiia bacterium]|nr:WhiB family transcriptional regulator [Acidimicrobiia bacterium]
MNQLIEIEPQFWREGAACVSRPEVDFFTDRGEEIVRAKAVCDGCPVRDECLVFAIETNQADGIWGGYTWKERAKIRRRWSEDYRRAG